jgi:hypothetical protein
MRVEDNLRNGHRNVINISKAIVVGWLTLVLIAVQPSSAFSGDKHGPQIAIDKRGQSAARTSTLRLSDLPVGWVLIKEPQPTGRDVRLACDSFSPDVAHLTVTGLRGTAFQTPNRNQVVSSLVMVFDTAADARRMYSADYQPYFRLCLFPRVGQLKDGLRFLSARRLPMHVPPHVKATAARAVVAGNGIKEQIDQIIVTRGARIAILVFQADAKNPVPDTLERALLRTQVERLGT